MHSPATTFEVIYQSHERGWRATVPDMCSVWGPSVTRTRQRAREALGKVLSDLAAGNTAVLVERFEEPAHPAPLAAWEVREFCRAVGGFRQLLGAMPDVGTDADFERG